MQDETWQGRQEALRKAWDPVRWKLLEGADIDDEANDGQTRPGVRSVEDPLSADLDRCIER